MKTTGCIFVVFVDLQVGHGLLSEVPHFLFMSLKDVLESRVQLQGFRPNSHGYRDVKRGGTKPLQKQRFAHLWQKQRSWKYRGRKGAASHAITKDGKELGK